MILTDEIRRGLLQNYSVWEEDDDGNVKGINVSNKLKSQVQDIARKCDPSIKIEIDMVNSRKVLVINVSEGKDKPYKCKEGFYLRQGANSQKMKRMLRVLSFAVITKYQLDNLLKPFKIRIIHVLVYTKLLTKLTVGKGKMFQFQRK